MRETRHLDMINKRCCACQVELTGLFLPCSHSNNCNFSGCLLAAVANLGNFCGHLRFSFLQNILGKILRFLKPVLGISVESEIFLV